MKKYFFFFFGIALIHFECRRLDLDSPLPFFEVSTTAANRLDKTNVGTVVVVGRLVKTNGFPIKRCGFVWSENLVAVSAPRPADDLPVLTATPPSGDADFTSDFTSARPKTPVYFRAFAEMETDAGTRKIFAPEVKVFTLGDMVAMTEQDPVVYNDHITVEGRLIGWNDLNAGAQRHGHVFSSKNTDPKLGLPDCVDSVKSTSYSVDYDFTTKISGLEFNTDYYIRSYAITEADTFYSTVVKKATVTDGWKRLPNDLPGLHADGLAVVHQGKAYLGLGCFESGFCFVDKLTKNYRQFDPAANAGVGEWKLLAPFGGGTPPANGVSFVIQDSIYVLFGGYQAVSPDEVLFNLPLVGFWKYLPNTNQWIKPPAPPSSIYGRSSAVAFVLNGKAYVGGGYYEDANDNFKDYYLNDFWEYNPVNGKWRSVASLPVRFNSVEHDDWGRHEAASFVLGNRAFVGGGFGDGRSYHDFWEFVPPVHDSDPGSWKFTGNFKGKSRIEAVSFSIGEKGYYGLGYHYADGPSEQYAYYLDDWWEFDPAAAEPWRQRTAFQGGRRGRAMGFGIGSSGYAGGGLINQLDSSQTVIIEGLRPDFWKYTPAKK